MTKLEDLKPGLQITGITPQQSVTIVDVRWHGNDAIELTYKRADGRPGSQLVFRDDSADIAIVKQQRQWDFRADGDRFRLVAEAFRIHLAHLFDPVLAVHTSLIEPLPHQITAVYGEMLNRQPLRFLLADDPGSGKTIMAGLLVKELMVRGDVRRCLICVPGNLATQWQDELWFKFQLQFEIISRDTFDNAVSGNPFVEKEQAIIRLDQIARGDDLKAQLGHSEWDLVIVDEAHKMSASFWGNELKFTKRYRLGELLSEITRHFLLMTATPHNGKEKDFQLFLSLIDPDRFENRSGAHDQPTDVSDIMRRMVKEDLCRFDGRPLFPERRAYTIKYDLSPPERELYEAVTEYVREEFNRAEQLASLIQDNEHMVDAEGKQRKLVIFTEHVDTRRYLWQRIATLFGREDNMVYIDGGLSRDKRREVEDRFRNDPDVHFLLATDAAGEGINLQRAHLMVNYDLPWNPNRLEQRFGRIHRIGQTEVCHLWNLVANKTREGKVYKLLLRKLETENNALDGQVFDVLGALFEQKPLRELLMEAIRYGDRPDVRARLEQTVDNTVDRERVRDLLETKSLVTATMDTSQIRRIRADMERYAARRLQPHYIRSFFLQAFAQLGGSVREREPGRYRVSHVPAPIRNHAQAIATPRPVLRQYERVCFEKALIRVPGQPLADFICPGHPLLDTVIDLVLARQRNLLRSGTVLVDKRDPATTPRMLFFLKQTIRDATQEVISREVHFVEIDADGDFRTGGYAPYLDYEAATADERDLLADHLTADWLAGEELEDRAISYAIGQLVPRHLQRVRRRREERIDKTLAAVQERLTKEINYWDRRAAELRRQEKEGKLNARLNSKLAQRRADELQARLGNRKEALAQERQIAASPPVVVGGALVAPAGLLYSLQDRPTPPELLDRRITESIAMQAVMEAEVALGKHPRDVSEDNLGYDIESLDPDTGRLRFIEVKGRKAGNGPPTFCAWN